LGDLFDLDFAGLRIWLERNGFYGRELTKDVSFGNHGIDLLWETVNVDFGLLLLLLVERKEFSDK
jgi:hypothetical protein